MSVEQVAMIKKSVTRDKKAKINWLMAVTQISLNQLSIVAEELGFVIKGDYVALPSEVENIRESEPYKPIKFVRPLPRLKEPVRLRPHLKKPLKNVNNYRFCTSCGIALKDTGNAHYLSGFCSNCGFDLNAIFTKKKDQDPYQKKSCSRCGSINPDTVLFCFYCGSDSLSSIL